MTTDGFTGYPEDHVLAAFASRSDAAAALDELRDGDIPESDYAVYSGEEGADAIDSDGTSHGLGAVMVRSIQVLVTDHDRMVPYQNSVKAGGVVIAARAEDEDRKHEISALLQRHNATDVRYFGSMTVEDLSVDPSRTRMG